MTIFPDTTRMRAKQDALSAEKLRKILDYCPVNGTFRWLVRVNGRWPAGSLAGSVNNRGYSRIGIGKHVYLAHRLAWFYVHGAWPRNQVDHDNGRRSDNRLCNLRLATKSQNSQNCCIYRNNKSGYKGVSWKEDRSKWRAAINIKGKQVVLGYFYNIKEAHLAYTDASTSNYGVFRRS